MFLNNLFCRTQRGVQVAASGASAGASAAASFGFRTACGHVTSGMATPSVAAPKAPLRAIQLIYDRISEP